MVNNARILAVDDDKDILFTIEVILEEIASELIVESDPSEIPQLLSEKSFDVILLDMNFTKDVINGEEGYYWLEKIKAIAPCVPVIFITAYADIDRAIKAIQAGAYDFITKPWQNEKLIATVNAAVHFSRSQQESRLITSQRKMIEDYADKEFNNIVGSSPQIREVFRTVKKIADTDTEVLITGENGTGKELIARAIHRLSKRRNEVFLSVDMGAVNQQLFDSELFGHKKGAFTGANQERVGKIAAAKGGSLFLDEIGNLTPELQARMLKVLEERRVCPLGSNKSVAVDVRLISATNLNLDEAVEEGRFRNDLLFRINTIEIHIPPLRERKADIPILCRFFISRFNKKYNKNIKGCSQSALRKMNAYNFPGNVRELKHIIHRAVILCSSNTITSEDLTLKTAVRCSSLKLYSLNIESAEEKLIKEALTKYSGNMSHAAKALGINRTSLYRRIKKYGL